MKVCILPWSLYQLHVRVPIMKGLEVCPMKPLIVCLVLVIGPMKSLPKPYRQAEHQLSRLILYESESIGHGQSAQAVAW